MRLSCVKICFDLFRRTVLQEKNREKNGYVTIFFYDDLFQRGLELGISLFGNKDRYVVPYGTCWIFFHQPIQINSN